MAGAVAMGYSNIFVTAPSPENLNTLFEFVFKGLDAMDYKVGTVRAFSSVHNIRIRRAHHKRFSFSRRCVATTHAACRQCDGGAMRTAPAPLF